MKLQKFAIVMLSLPLLAAVTACQKDDSEKNTEILLSFGNGSFNSKINDIDLIGNTIVLKHMNWPLLIACPIINYLEQEEWIVNSCDEYAWVSANYIPATGTLSISGWGNDSGRQRTAILNATRTDGQRVIYRIVQNCL